MLNCIVLIGRLARDPELRYTPSGVAVATFTLAVDRPFTNPQGEREADFIDIVVWRRLAESCANHLSKGRLVSVRGRLQIRTYETQDGQRRRVAEVVADEVKFLDSPRRATASDYAGSDYPDVPFDDTGFASDTGFAGVGAEDGGAGMGYVPPDDIPF